MRVLIVHNKYRQYGGEDTVVDQEIKAYQELGCEVCTYLTSNSSLTVFDFFFSPFNLLSAFRFKKKIKQFRPNVIHIHNFIFKLSPSIFIVIPKNIKVFTTIHNYRFLCPSGTLFFKNKINLKSKTFSGLLQNVFLGVYQGSILKTFMVVVIYKINLWLGTFNKTKYIFLTDFSKKLHQDWNKKAFLNSYVKPNFLFKDIQEPQITTKPIDIIFIGRFTKEKGLPSVINTLKKAKNLKIHLVGNGPLYSDLKNQCSQYTHIIFHGELNRKKTIKLLSKSKFLLFPSIWYEGMPMTIIEAYSEGVPVICKNLGAMTAMVHNYKTGFHYKDSDELETLLSIVLNIEYESISKRAYREFEKKYSKHAAIKNLKKLISV